MNDFFSSEGHFYSFMRKAGEIIIVNVLCLICMIPVVTVIPALSAMYYSTIKSVRRERGYVHKEFFRSFKHCLGKGILFSIIYEGIIAIIIFNMTFTNELSQQFTTIYYLILIFMLISLIYLVPVLSRFNMKFLDMIKLSLVMAVRHFPTTLLLAIGTGLVVFLQLTYLPILLIVCVPGIWCYVSTFLIERVLKKYMNKMDDDKETDKWWLE